MGTIDQDFETVDQQTWTNSDKDGYIETETFSNDRPPNKYLNLTEASTVFGIEAKSNGYKKIAFRFRMPKLTTSTTSFYFAVSFSANHHAQRIFIFEQNGQTYISSKDDVIENIYFEKIPVDISATDWSSAIFSVEPLAELPGVYNFTLKINEFEYSAHTFADYLAYWNANLLSDSFEVNIDDSVVIENTNNDDPPNSVIFSKFGGPDFDTKNQWSSSDSSPFFSQDDLALTIKTTDNIPVGITFEATKDFDIGYPYFKSFSARFDTVKAIAITFQSPVEEIFNVTLGTDGTVKVCGNEVTGQKIQNDDFILSVYQAPDFFDTQNVMLTADTFTVPIKELLNCVPTWRT